MIQAKDIEGILFDLDGVLHVGSRPVDGASDAVRSIKESGIACRFITNTSTMSLAGLHGRLLDLGLPVAAEEIISAPQAVLRYLADLPDARCCLLLAEDVRRDFAGIRQVDIDEADYIVLGDIGDAMSCEFLNRIFNRLMAGSRLIAVHKNRFWETERGLRMDIGAFVAALEYCTGVESLVIGKPAAAFFRIALRDMGISAAEAVVVGDDIDSDIGGGRRVGLRGILVRTGKYRQPYVDASPIRPDCIIDSVRDLPKLLGIR